MIKEKVFHKIFWLLLILFTNIGGIQQALGIYQIAGSLNLNDALVFIMLAIYLLVYKREKQPGYYKRMSIFILLFVLYYFIVYVYVTPIVKDNEGSLVFNLIKSRWVIYSFLVFHMTYYFTVKSHDIFVKYQLFIGIFILTLFIQSFFTGVRLLPEIIATRGFVNLNRHLLLNYGLMPLFVYLGAVIIAGPFSKLNNRRLVMVAFILMELAWFLSITRRHIFGSILIIVLAYLVLNRLRGISLKPIFVNALRISLALLFLIGIVITVFPKYYDAIKISIYDTALVVVTGENSIGSEDERLSFNRSAINQTFYSNPYLGTGFDNLWRLKEGDKKGFEATDYPFLSALAMTGLFGVLSFLPVYILLIGMIREDFRFYRMSSMSNLGVAHLFHLSLMLFFVYELFQYMNWFHYVSNAGNNRSFIYLALYTGFFAVVRKNNKTLR